jgi:hypothetical protein
MEQKGISKYCNGTYLFDDRKNTCREPITLSHKLSRKSRLFLFMELVAA